MKLYQREGTDLTKETKDSLVKGTLILTVAALVARFLGVFQRIPLVHLLHEEGMGSYSIAFNLYSILLVVATAGIPSALSKMVSEKYAIGRPAEARANLSCGDLVCYRCGCRHDRAAYMSLHRFMPNKFHTVDRMLH